MDIQHEIMWSTRQAAQKSFKIYQQIQINKLLIHWTHNNPTIHSKQNHIDKCPTCANEMNTIPHFYQCQSINTIKQWTQSLKKLQRKMIIPPL